MKTIVKRLTDGQDLMMEIKRLLEEHDVQAGVILSAVGSLKESNISVAETASWLHTVAWAWIDVPKGLIRARTFAADWDIPEAQGNGSSAMVLAARLGRTIEIRHGKGAVIFAKPAQDNQADIGGRIVCEKEFADS